MRRYFELIIFQAYLQSIKPDTLQSFESVETFVKDRPGNRALACRMFVITDLFRPVIKTFEKELMAEGLNALKPLERADVADGVAHPDEVNQVVLNRTGIILSASTILKSDLFANLQKMSLPE